MDLVLHVYLKYIQNIMILFRSRLCKSTEPFVRIPLCDLYTIILINYKDLKLFNILHIIYRVSPNKFSILQVEILYLLLY